MAAVRGSTSCPQAALFFSLTLLGIKTKADFNRNVKMAYKQALGRMAPGALLVGCGVDMLRVLLLLACFTCLLLCLPMQAPPSCRWPLNPATRGRQC